ncbi:hypothetical protein ACFE04_028605 [Oxalis oulophora]
MDSLNILFFLLLITSSIFYPSIGVLQEVQSAICSTTQNATFCKNIFKSDSRTDNADLKKLLWISIGLTQKQANHNLKIFTKLFLKEIEPVLEEAYYGCMHDYHTIELDLVIARKISRRQNYTESSKLLDRSLKLAFHCSGGVYKRSIAIDKIESDMFLTTETANGVNKYIISHVTNVTLSGK